MGFRFELVSYNSYSSIRCMPELTFGKVKIDSLLERNKK